MSRVWLIYHGLDHGHREDCSIFYEEPEIFLDESLFESRKQEILRLQEQAKQSSEIFVDGSKYKGSTDAIKRRFLKEYNIPYECSSCKINSWMNQKLSLQLDHKNGRRNDNRPENLRLLCPNCHSLTQTFAGRNRKPR
mgnify:FL=1